MSNNGDIGIAYSKWLMLIARPTIQLIFDILNNTFGKFGKASLNTDLSIITLTAI